MKVTIECDRGKLRLRWFYQGKRVNLSLGVDDNATGRAFAKLSHVSLAGANLSGVNLSGTVLNDVCLANIKWNLETVWPSKEAFAQTKNIPDELRKHLDLQD